LVLSLAAVCLSVLARADSVKQRIETVLGPSAPYEQVFEQLRSAVAAGDAHGAAALVHYPIRVNVAGRVSALAQRQEIRGYINDGRLRAGDAAFTVNRSRDGLVTSQVGDQSNVVRCRRIN